MNGRSVQTTIMSIRVCSLVINIIVSGSLDNIYASKWPSQHKSPVPPSPHQRNTIQTAFRWRADKDPHLYFYFYSVHKMGN